MSHMEKLLLQYIIRFKEVNGFAPTLKEMRQGLNTKSDNWLLEMLNNLEKEEYITKVEKSPRTIIVVRFPE